MDRWIALSTLAAFVALCVAVELKRHIRHRIAVAADRRRTNDALRMLRRGER